MKIAINRKFDAKMKSRPEKGDFLRYDEFWCVSNLLLTIDGDPKVSDFGLAKWLDVPSREGRNGVNVGTREYIRDRAPSRQSLDRDHLPLQNVEA